MIEEVTGNLLEADVEALVNTVNTVGVMGKGVALQFKKAFPDMFRAYAAACAAGQLEPGQVQVYECPGLLNPRYIINFATKRHWRESSKLEYIDTGLVALVSEVKNRDIRSLALPALGSGLGGLDWNAVYPRIQAAFVALPNVRVLVYPPQPAPDAANIVHRTPRPEMTPARAHVLHILRAYRVLGYELSLLEAQKLLYFLQIAGEPLRLQFAKGHYGPYADNLRHVLNQFEGHFTRGYAEGRSAPKTIIELLPDALAEAEALIAREVGQHADTEERLQRVLQLINGFESPYGMELLASVHWVATQEPNVTDAETAITAVHRWNPRKQRYLKPAHIRIAWQRLAEQHWLDQPVRVL